MTDAIPRKAAGLLVEDLDEEIVILVETTDQIVILNETAAEIWRLIDGARSRGAIVAAFAQIYRDVDPGQIARDVDEVLTDLVGKGLVSA